MNQKEIEMAVDMGATILCDQGTVIKGSRKGTYYIRASNGHMVGLGTEQYGLNGSNFREPRSYGIDTAEQNEGIDNWSNENCPSDNT